MDLRPVGMFDSGVGGLSVLDHLHRIRPAENIVYFADTAYFPYGPRPAAEVRKRAFQATHALLGAGAKLIVVACNTASAAAIADLRQAFSDVPFVGMVPGLKPAAALSRNRQVAILATPGTLDGDLYQRVVDEFGEGTAVRNVPGHGLAELVEAGGAGSPRAVDLVRAALAPEIEAGADTVVLGCTHYHFLAPAIAAAFPLVAIVDTSGPVAQRAAQLLDERELGAPPGHAGTITFVVTGDAHAFRRVAEGLGFSSVTEGVA